MKQNATHESRSSEYFPRINSILQDPSVDDETAMQLEDLALQVYENSGWFADLFIKTVLKKADVKSLVKQINKDLKSCAQAGVSAENITLFVDSLVDIAAAEAKDIIHKAMQESLQLR